MAAHDATHRAWGNIPCPFPSTGPGVRRAGCGCH
jgi:hypothetical protein